MAALQFMGWLILNSSKEMQVDEEIRVVPFKLDAESEKNPSHFEVCFLLNEVRYRYGFEVDRIAVKKEWLFRAEKVKEEALFLREGNGIEVTGDFPEGNGLEEKTRDNALFLSVAAQFNGKISGDILREFKGIKTLYGLQDQRYERYTAGLLLDESMRNLLVEFIRTADVGIEDLVVNELPFDEDLKGVPDEVRSKIRMPRQLKMATVHRKFRDGVAEGLVNLDFATEESEGTKKFFRIAGPVLDCLRNGYVVAVDELDAKLHPLLTKAIVHLFNSAESNPKNAQLIFVTHDTNLLHYGKLRRDQVWFTEKNEQASTTLYSLAEFKLAEGGKVRNDAAFEKNYIEGRYGAIPFLGNFGDLFKEE